MENLVKRLPVAACRVVWRGARVWCCDGVVIFTNCAPVAQLDQSVWLRTSRKINPSRCFGCAYGFRVRRWPAPKLLQKLLQKTFVVASLLIILHREAVGENQFRLRL